MVYLTDFHTHLLPNMDDGSKSVSQSLEMLGLLGAQGVGRVVASPHFYANDESVEDFVARREAAFDKLKPHITADMPSVVMGAEVRYYDGIGRLDGLEKLCIQGTSLLLLEMPAARWGEYTLREVTDIACRGSLRVVLAHVERYLHLQNSSVAGRLAGDGVLMQMNAESFTGFMAKRRALGLLASGAVQFIGSDCHNLTDRPPNMRTAAEAVERKLGKGFLTELAEFGNSFFEE